MMETNKQDVCSVMSCEPRVQESVPDCWDPRLPAHALFVDGEDWFKFYTLVGESAVRMYIGARLF